MGEYAMLMEMQDRLDREEAISPMREAARGDVEGLKREIARGIVFNEANEFGLRLLRRALGPVIGVNSAPHKEIIRLLINAGAVPDEYVLSHLPPDLKKQLEEDAAYNRRSSLLNMRYGPGGEYANKGVMRPKEGGRHRKTHRRKKTRRTKRAGRR